MRVSGPLFNPRFLRSSWIFLRWAWKRTLRHNLLKLWQLSLFSAANAINGYFWHFYRKIVLFLYFDKINGFRDKSIFYWTAYTTMLLKIFLKLFTFFTYLLFLLNFNFFQVIFFKSILWFLKFNWCFLNYMCKWCSFRDPFTKNLRVYCRKSF